MTPGWLLYLFDKEASLAEKETIKVLQKQLVKYTKLEWKPKMY